LFIDIIDIIYSKVVHINAVVTALHWIQSGLVRRKLSVCSSVKCVNWENGRKTCPDFYTIRKIL